MANTSNRKSPDTEYTWKQFDVPEVEGSFRSAVQTCEQKQQLESLMNHEIQRKSIKSGLWRQRTRGTNELKEKVDKRARLSCKELE
jgi:hypothetical protein